MFDALAAAALAAATATSDRSTALTATSDRSTALTATSDRSTALTATSDRSADVTAAATLVIRTGVSPAPLMPAIAAAPTNPGL
jgi:hypothetical protein